MMYKTDQFQIDLFFVCLTHMYPHLDKITFSPYILSVVMNETYTNNVHTEHGE